MTRNCLPPVCPRWRHCLLKNRFALVERRIYQIRAHTNVGVHVGVHTRKSTRHKRRDRSRALLFASAIKCRSDELFPDGLAWYEFSRHPVIASPSISLLFSRCRFVIYRRLRQSPFRVTSYTPGTGTVVCVYRVSPQKRISAVETCSLREFKVKFFLPHVAARRNARVRDNQIILNWVSG